MKLIRITTALLLLASQSGYAADARAIIKQVLDRDDGRSEYSRQTVATCKYTLNNQRLQCSERPRIKVMEAIRKDSGANGKDSQSIMIIEEPPAEKGIGFLQFDYDQEGKDSDQWMYLSALGKVKRIVSGDEDQPKTGSLFGSEFSYEDTERRHIDDFTYTIVKEEPFAGRDCWVIESKPTPAQARKSNYSRSEQWIDKERFIIHKAIMYDRRGRANKQLIMSDYQQHDGVWVAHKMNINNVQTQRITTMKTENITLNLKVEDAIMSQRTLTDGAFREGHLARLRSAIKK